MISEPEMNTLLNDGVEYKYECSDDKGVYGTFRIEVMPDFLGVHVTIVRATVATCRALKNEMQTTVKDLLKKFGFSYCMVLTPHKNLLKFLSNGTEKQVGKILNMPLYMIEAA